MKYLSSLTLLSFLILVSGCGSMEPVKRYNYPITKYQLHSAISKVIHSNPNIIVDTNKVKIGAHIKDSAAFARYLKGELKIKIKAGDKAYDYVLHYIGDEAYWQQSKTSAIGIQRASDEAGNIVYQGQNDNGEFKSEAALALTALFEKEVIHKTDQLLHIKHSIH